MPSVAYIPTHEHRYGPGITTDNFSGIHLNPHTDDGWVYIHLAKIQQQPLAVGGIIGPATWKSIHDKITCRAIDRTPKNNDHYPDYTSPPRTQNLRERRIQTLAIKLHPSPPIYRTPWLKLKNQKVRDDVDFRSQGLHPVNCSAVLYTCHHPRADPLPTIAGSLSGEARWLRMCGRRASTLDADPTEKRLFEFGAADVSFLASPVLSVDKRRDGGLEGCPTAGCVSIVVGE